MCGEMAGDEKAIPLLVGMGLYEFSMSASSILPARALIKRTSRQEWSGFADQIVSMRNQTEVLTFIENNMRSESH